MHPTFFTIAREGENSWKTYVKAALSVLGITYIPAIVAGFIAGFTGHDGLFSEDFESIAKLYSQLFKGDPIRYNLFMLVLFILLGVGLFYAMTRVHKRKFLTLIEPSGNVRWHRFAQGFGVWIALDALTTLAVLALNPARYNLVFDAANWFSWALTAVPMIMIAGTLAALLLYGYLLQGLSLLVRQPMRLLIIWSLIIGTLLSIQSPAYWLLITLRQAFYLWIIYKDDGLSLFLGLGFADSLLSNLIFGLNIPDLSTSKSPAVFHVAEPLSPIYGILITIILNALFYFICFKKPLVSS